MTTLEFKKSLKNNNSRYCNGEFEICDEYKNLKQKIRCKCNKGHGFFYPRADKLLYRNNGCPVCSGRGRSGCGMTHEEFTEGLHKHNKHFHNGDFKIISTYSGVSVKIKCECNICGNVWEDSKEYLYRGVGCPICTGRAKKKSIIDKVVDITRRCNLEYTGVVEDGVYSFKCLDCDKTFLMTCDEITKYYHYYFKKGMNPCPSCSTTTIRKKYTPNSYADKLAICNHDVILIDEYKNNIKKQHRFKCCVCGNYFVTSAENMLRGGSCPHCRIVHADDYYKQLQTHNSYYINGGFTLLDEFVSCNTKIKYKCGKCGCVKKELPYKILNVKSCATCKKNEEIIQDLKVKNNHYKKQEFNITYDLSVKLNQESNVVCKCNICDNVWDAKIIDLYNNHFCPICEKKGMINSLSSQLRNYNKYYSNKEFDIIDIDGKCSITCKCNHCGNIWVTSQYVLMHNSCGCPICGKKHISHGELRIESFLINNNIRYLKQYQFDDLVGIGNGKLSYDFYLPDLNILIEYNGEQHYRPIRYFGGINKFEKQRYHDKLKRLYAIDHNIRLYEIWYWDFDYIDEIINGIVS